MLFDWNDQTIRYYTQANDYTGFFANLAEIVAARVDPQASFCDIGCGLGLIDLALADRLRDITCIDNHPAVLAALRRSVRERGLTNIRIVEGDGHSIKDHYGTIYLCFFGSREIPQFLPHCGKLLAVVSGGSHSELFPGKYRTDTKNTAEGTKAALDALRIPYKLDFFDFEFGQPFTGYDDAVNYIKVYAPAIPDAELAAFLEARLQHTGREDYPLFMPRRKQIGLFEIDGRARE